MSDSYNLHKAKINENDEFYTQYEDIEEEINMYFEDNPNLFKDKTVLCPCDDPDWSNFTKYFVNNFEKLGLKKLISTSYAVDYKKANQPNSLFDIVNSDKKESLELRGKILIVDKDNYSEKVDWKFLKGNGDFRSEEITNFRDEADFIITNPPFSLFRSFLKWLLETPDKFFILIGSNNAITYKEFFSCFRDNKVWRSLRGIPPLYYFTNKEDLKDNNKSRLKRVLGEWYTNIPIKKDFKEFKMNTLEENVRYNKRLKMELKRRYNANTYCKYDNFKAIDIPILSAIPSDYKGIMGVPVSFQEIYHPNQFKIVGMTSIPVFCKAFSEDGHNTKDPVIKGKTIFRRIFIQNLYPEESKIDYEKEGWIENLSTKKTKINLFQLE